MNGNTEQLTPNKMAQTKKDQPKPYEIDLKDQIIVNAMEYNRLVDRVSRLKEELARVNYYRLKELSSATPHSYKTGEWDGEMSDDLLLLDDKDQFHVGVCYQGHIDGMMFCDFYNKADYEIEGVQKWAYLPE